MINITLESERATAALGGRLSSAVAAGGVVFLVGNLGVGKTTLVREYLRSLGYTGAVKSPTYTLMEHYVVSGKRIFHLDLYRIADPAELEFVGVRDLLDGESILLVEWPEQGSSALPSPDLVIELEHAGNARHCRVQANSEAGNRILAQLRFQYGC